MDWLKPGVWVPPAGPNTPLSTLTWAPQPDWAASSREAWVAGARGGLHTKANPDGDVVLVLVGSLRGGCTHRCHRQGAFLTTLNPQSCDKILPRKRWGPVSLRHQVSIHSSLPLSAFPQPHSICRANPVWLDPFCRNLELAAQAEHEDDLPENLSEVADLWNSPTRTHVSLGQSGRGHARVHTWTRVCTHVCTRVRAVYSCSS